MPCAALPGPDAVLSAICAAGQGGNRGSVGFDQSREHRFLDWTSAAVPHTQWSALLGISSGASALPGRRLPSDHSAAPRPVRRGWSARPVPYQVGRVWEEHFQLILLNRSPAGLHFSTASRWLGSRATTGWHRLQTWSC
jgi:hypothetical protein